VPHEEPDRVVALVGEHPRAPAAAALLEPVVELALQGAEAGRRRHDERRHLGAVGLVVLERPRAVQVLLGVLGLQQLPVEQPHLHGDVGRRLVGPLVQLQPGTAGGGDQRVHAGRRGHLVDEEQRVEQFLGRPGLGGQEHLDEPVVVDRPGGAGRRQGDAAAGQVVAVGVEEPEQARRVDRLQDVGTGEPSESERCHGCALVACGFGVVGRATNRRRPHAPYG
jgi:hypothetical protein